MKYERYNTETDLFEVVDINDEDLDDLMEMFDLVKAEWEIDDRKEFLLDFPNNLVIEECGSFFDYD